MKPIYKYLIVLLFTGLTFQGFAQQGDAREMQEKIRAARIAMITERLNLTPEQAQKFWPVYNEFTSKRREIRKELNQAIRSIDRENASEQEMKDLVALRLKVKQQELDLEKQYSTRLLDVISTQQLVKLSQAEADFRQKVQRTIEERRRRRQNMQNRPADRQLDRKNN